MAKRWEPLKVYPRQAEYTKFPQKATVVDSFQLARMFGSIRELNEEVAELRGRSKQVETLTSQIVGDKDWRVIRYLLWKNIKTGVYLAEIRIEESIKTPIQGKGYPKGPQFTTHT